MPIATCTPTPRRIALRRTLHRLGALTAALALAACGGGSDDAPTTPAPPAPPPTAATTTVSGAVVKGPVNGAQVCAYAVTGGMRGAALGGCTTSDANGNYSFAVPASSGALWLEATGGSYIDETTAAMAALPVGSPLTALAAANGSATTSMLTPLTTLALNAARTVVGANGALDSAAFAAAAVQLLAAFNLPATLDIRTTQPAFGSAANAYGTALVTISRMVAAGTPLASILGTTQPSLLSAAYAAAVSGGGTPGSASASGTLTVAGTTAAGAASSLTPQPDGFEIGLKSSGGTTYRFFRTTTSPSTLVEVQVSVALNGATSVSYFDQASRTSGFCTTNCGVTVTPANGATHPVTVAFANTPLGGALTLNGSLVGDAPGAAWTLTDLPGGSTSSLTLGGNSVRVLTSSDSTIDGGGTLLRSITLGLSDGSTVSMSQSGSAAFSVTRVLPPATLASCGTACNVAVADGSGTRITFSNTPLSGGLVLNGTVDFERTSGSLTTSDTGSFTPVASNIETLNGKRTLTFNVLGTAAQAGLSLLTVDVVGGRIVRAQATVGISTQVLSCFDNGAVIGVPACSGITAAADGRTVSFSNAVLRGGPIGAAARDVVFNGTLVAKGP